MGSKPNILIVILDSARPAWLGCYDGALRTSPNIDRVAGEGIVFDTAISPSAWTFPVMASVFTAMMSAKHGGHDEHRVLDSAYPTMAEIFARHGYDTAAISDVPYVGPMTHLDRGFATMSNLRRNQVSLPNQVLKAVGRAHRVITGQYQKTNETKVVIRESIGWLDRQWDRDKPFLLYVHSDEPHAPLLPPARYRRQFTNLTARQMRAINQDKQLYVGGAVTMTDQDFANLRDLVRAEVAFFDAWLGRLMRYMAKENLLDNTVVVITADHAENFGEHGLMRHGLCLYETLIHVPLIIRIPGRRPAHRVEPMVRLIDLLPTLMAIAEIDQPDASREFQGQNLLECIRTQQFPDYAIGELYRPTSGLFEKKVPEFMPDFRRRFDRVLRSYRTPRHKFIWSSNGDHELYDLEKDPGEQRDLVAGEPGLAGEMQSRLDAWLNSFQRADTLGEHVEDQAVDERVLERLRDLGYIE